MLLVYLSYATGPVEGTLGSQVARVQPRRVQNDESIRDVATKFARLLAAEPGRALTVASMHLQDLLHRHSSLHDWSKAELPIVAKHNRSALTVETLMPSRHVLVQKLFGATTNLTGGEIGQVRRLHRCAPREMSLQRLGCLVHPETLGPQKSEETRLQRFAFDQNAADCLNALNPELTLQCLHRCQVATGKDRADVRCSSDKPVLLCNAISRSRHTTFCKPALREFIHWLCSDYCKTSWTFSKIAANIVGGTPSRAPFRKRVACRASGVSFGRRLRS
mmetsp:Transcript_143469/g.364151  ORF Transcript_143469/g.364151 Transcript_143469/m.364151 type:complete len:277 (+) Transcript_143469:174-1004(+)